MYITKPGHPDTHWLKLSVENMKVTTDFSSQITLNMFEQLSQPIFKLNDTEFQKLVIICGYGFWILLWLSVQPWKYLSLDQDLG